MYETCFNPVAAAVLLVEVADELDGVSLKPPVALADDAGSAAETVGAVKVRPPAGGAVVFGGADPEGALKLKDDFAVVVAGAPKDVDIVVTVGTENPVGAAADGALPKEKPLVAEACG